MRAAVLRDGRMVYRDDVPEPVPGPGDVLVAVRGMRNLRLGPAFRQARRRSAGARAGRSRGTGGDGGMNVDVNRDIFMGHEFSAEVLEAGPDTDAPAPGTLVTSIPVLVSANGVEPIVYSNTTIGGYAERMLLSAPLLTPIPNGLEPRHAALTEPMAVGPARGQQVGDRAQRDGAGAGLRADRYRDHRGASKTNGVETIVAADY